MTREEKTAWAFVGSEVIIIILLLLINAPPSVQDETINIGGITFPPLEPFTLNIETRPPNAFPVSIQFGDVVNTNPQYISNNPCDCGCSGGATYIPQTDWSSYIAGLNDSLRNGVIGNVQHFFSQLPGDLYFLTNNTRIPALETAIWN